MSHFFAYVSRLKQILRWGLMRNTRPENDMEHTTQVAWIAHALGLYANERNPEKPVDLGRVALLALYHDVPEVITGDLATPVKYFNPEIKRAYQDLEHVAARKLLAMLPRELHPAYEDLLIPDENTPEWRLVKAADKLAAYLKCLEEEKAGNQEFSRAAVSIRQTLSGFHMPEVDRFLEEFVPSFALTLDELN